MGRTKGSRLPQSERTNAELAAAVPGLTRRQLEYWVEKRWVLAEHPPARGHPRSFGPAEIKVLRTMVRLVNAGFPAQVAAQVARRAVATAVPDLNGRGQASVPLYGGDLLVVISDI